MEVFEDEILKHERITMQAYLRALVKEPVIVMVNLCKKIKILVEIDFANGFI